MDFPQPRIEKDVTLKRVTLGAYTEIKAHSSLEEVSVGAYSYFAGSNQAIYASIGKFSSIATFVRINPGNHPCYDRVAQHHFTYRSAEFGFAPDDSAFFEGRRQHRVIIGNDVWIGHNAVVMPGVKIGDGAVIGSASVVTRDIPPYAVAVGVPARVIRMRFSDEMIEKIARCRWWDWSHEEIKERLGAFRDINKFADNYL
jgi:phosphonate metabolism protein (transferase hexapeptide repeat family)